MDDMESKLAHGLEEDLGVKAMAAKLAPRQNTPPGSLETATLAHRQQMDAGLKSQPASPYQRLQQVAPQGTVEAKLQGIEKLIGEVRILLGEIKERL